MSGDGGMTAEERKGGELCVCVCEELYVCAEEFRELFDEAEKSGNDGDAISDVDIIMLSRLRWRNFAWSLEGRGAGGGARQLLPPCVVRAGGGGWD